ncbi:MAG: glycosyltransferase [Bacteroides sp.]|nr:glycosyltransferase [Roseburia sp.]MCM1346919.1 glycosyltransferase [Bacteroides sp.]MCM1421450.1 glycosyltransferase [Bacteroides sp.]
MDTPKVSIIVPTYNVEKYLLQCLESIANQTYTNYEVIIIIDGSTDRSYEIAKDFCVNHEKFAVYWQENAGSGPARNNGLDHATGELVMFVDPDDWLGVNHLKNLVIAQQKGDYDLTASYRCTVTFNKYGKYTIHATKELMDVKSHDAKHIHANYYYYVCVLDNPTNKLYKKSIIDLYKIEFPDLRRSQDVVFNYRFFEFMSSLCIIPVADYYYRVLYTERINRIKPNYYKTLELMFNERREMHQRLGVDFPLCKACTEIYGSLIAVFEAYTIYGCKYDDLFKSNFINTVISNTETKGMIDKIRLLVIRTHNDLVIRVMMNLLCLLKKTFS